MPTSRRTYCPPDLSGLREFVIDTLCRTDRLVPNQFPLTEQILLRRGRPCGILYTLHGPRTVVLSAIWETDRNTILFYDSSGVRFFVAQVAKPPLAQLEELAHNNGPDEPR